MASPQTESYKRALEIQTSGSAKHSLVYGNVVTALNNHTRQEPCLVFSKGIRLQTRLADSFVSPDAMVVWDKADLQSGRPDTVTNPTLIVEGAGSADPRIRLCRKISALSNYSICSRISLGGLGKHSGHYNPSS